jgi:hypothetical protein
MLRCGIIIVDIDANGAASEERGKPKIIVETVGPRYSPSKIVYREYCASRIKLDIRCPRDAGSHDKD